MADLICTFAQLEQERQSSAGGKGGVLARLYQAGYRVPEGFVVLPPAFAGDQLTAEAWAQVQVQLERLRKKEAGVSFAVRSSALSEDSAFASFAGEFETVLDVHSDEMVRQAIHTVRRSRHSERVRAYSEAKGIDALHEMAVVVQRLVRADISGVLFTADPVAGNRGEMMGNFVYGFGEELVSGEAEPYTFAFKRLKGQYEGPPELKRFARRLYKLAVRLERDLGRPQDIEWAIADDKLYVLQSRPITTLVGYDPATGEWNDSLTGDYVWVNNGGVYPDVMTPSSWSLWQILLMNQVAGISAIGNIGGRMYANYSYVYTLFRKTGRSQEIAAEYLELVIGPIPQDMEVALLPISLKEILSSLLGLVFGALASYVKVRRRGTELIAAMPQRCRDLRQRIRETESASGLAALWDEQVRLLFVELMYLQDAANDGYFFPYLDLRRRLRELVGEEQANILISTLRGAAGELASIKPLIGLAQVARGEMSREAYVELAGHRAPNENELSMPRPYEDPSWLDRQLAEYERSPVDVESRMEEQAAKFDRLWGEFARAHPKEARSLRRNMDQVCEAMIKREAIRSELTRSVGVARAWFQRAGELTGLGEDIFFLASDEAIEVLSGDRSAVAYIPARRGTHEQYRALPPYPAVIWGRFDLVQWASDPNRRSDIFDSHATVPRPVPVSNVVRGLAGSAGRVEGVVRLLTSPEEGNQFIQGEILLASTTNVGWTPLFPRAAAVITDIGAPLSHAAIVARELGIPAVVGCGDATMRLKTGDRVLVNGGQGTVEILEHAE